MFTVHTDGTQTTGIRGRNTEEYRFYTPSFTPCHAKIISTLTRGEGVCVKTINTYFILHGLHKRACLLNGRIILKKKRKTVKQHSTLALAPDLMVGGTADAGNGRQVMPGSGVVSTADTEPVKQGAPEADNRLAARARRRQERSQRRSTGIIQISGEVTGTKRTHTHIICVTFSAAKTMCHIL